MNWNYNKGLCLLSCGKSVIYKILFEVLNWFDICYFRRSKRTFLTSNRLLCNFSKKNSSLEKDLDDILGHLTFRVILIIIKPMFFFSWSNLINWMTSYQIGWEIILLKPPCNFFLNLSPFRKSPFTLGIDFMFSWKWLGS